MSKYSSEHLPDTKKPPAFPLAVFNVFKTQQSIKITSCLFGLIHPHRFIAGFRPDAMQVAVKAGAVFPEKHERQRQNARCNRISTA
ncbi:hypothetical protein EL79_3179 [Escherichia coli]|nr:hypothetical protein EL79_3179 [Escherichia coli]